MQKKKKMQKKKCLEFLPFDQKLLLDSAKELLENCFWIRPNNSLKIASGFDQRTAWKLLLDSAKELLENCFWIRPKNCLKIASGFGQRTAWKLLLDSSKKLLENCFWIRPKNCLKIASGFVQKTAWKLLLDSAKELLGLPFGFDQKTAYVWHNLLLWQFECIWTKLKPSILPWLI